MCFVIAVALTAVTNAYVLPTRPIENPLQTLPPKRSALRMIEPWEAKEWQANLADAERSFPIPSAVDASDVIAPRSDGETEVSSIVAEDAVKDANDEPSDAFDSSNMDASLLEITNVESPSFDERLDDLDTTGAIEENTAPDDWDVVAQSEDTVVEVLDNNNEETEEEFALQPVENVFGETLEDAAVESNEPWVVASLQTEDDSQMSAYEAEETNGIQTAALSSTVKVSDPPMGRMDTGVSLDFIATARAMSEESTAPPSMDQDEAWSVENESEALDLNENPLMSFVDESAEYVESTGDESIEENIVSVEESDGMTSLRLEPMNEITLVEFENEPFDDEMQEVPSSDYTSEPLFELSDSVPSEYSGRAESSDSVAVFETEKGFSDAQAPDMIAEPWFATTGNEYVWVPPATPMVLSREERNALADQSVISLEVLPGVNPNTIKGAAIAAFAVSSVAGNQLPITVVGVVPIVSYLSITRGTTGQTIRVIGDIAWLWTSRILETVMANSDAVTLSNLQSTWSDVQSKTTQFWTQSSAWFAEQNSKWKQQEEERRLKQLAAQAEARSQQKVVATSTQFFIASSEQIQENEIEKLQRLLEEAEEERLAAIQRTLVKQKLVESNQRSLLERRLEYDFQAVIQRRAIAEQLRLEEEIRLAAEAAEARLIEEKRIQEEIRLQELQLKQEQMKVDRKAAESKQRSLLVARLAFDRKAAARAQEARRLEELLAAEAAAAEMARIEEENRLAEEAAAAEMARIEEENRLSEEAAAAELARIEEENRLAEEAAAAAEMARIEEENRLAEEAAVAEKARIEEENRIAEEAAAAAELARIEEENRLAEEAAAAEMARIEEENRIAEEAAAAAEKARIEEENRIAEEAAAAAAELARIEEENRLAEEAAAAEMARIEAENRLAEEAAAAEKARIEEENRIAEEAAAAAAELARIEEENRIAEEAAAAAAAAAELARIEEENRIAEEAAAAAAAELARIEEENRIAEEAAAAELARIEEENRIAEEAAAAAELARIEEENRLAEEAAVAEKARIEEENRIAEEAAAAAAELSRIEEENRLAEEAAAAAVEKARIEEENRISEEAAAELARIEEENRLAEEAAAKLARNEEDNRLQFKALQKASESNQRALLQARLALDRETTARIQEARRLDEERLSKKSTADSELSKFDEDRAAQLAQLEAESRLAAALLAVEAAESGVGQEIRLRVEDEQEAEQLRVDYERRLAEDFLSKLSGPSSSEATSDFSMNGDSNENRSGDETVNKQWWEEV